MFTETVNVACNNIPFNHSTIAGMHESMVRLYAVAAKHKGSAMIPSDLARVLTTSPQTITNWESRGISEAGALSAQEKFGCNANWLLGRSDHEYLVSPAPSDTNQTHRVCEPDPWQWPFELVDRKRYESLSKVAQGAAQLRMMDEVQAQETNTKTGNQFGT